MTADRNVHTLGTDFTTKNWARAQVEMTTTSVDVRWQDGQVDARVPARDLVPVAHLDEHEFFVGDLVEEIDPLADMNDDAQVRGVWGLC